MKRISRTHLLPLLAMLLAFALAGCKTQPVSEAPAPTKSGKTPVKTLDSKWSLWANGTQLRGVDIYQRRVYPKLDEGYMGPGDFGPPFTQKDFDDIAALGANFVVISHPGLFTEKPPYKPDPKAKANLDKLLEMATKADLFAVISFRTGPGRSEFWAFWGEDTQSDHKEGWFSPKLYNNTVWNDPDAQNAWAEMWRYTAVLYHDNPVVVGYELMCEPNANEVGSFPKGDPLAIEDKETFYGKYAGTLYDWNQLFPKISAAIRQVDADIPIIVDSMGYSTMDWLPSIVPSDDPHTVFTIHQYEPVEYTHQESGEESLSYPGHFDADYDGEPDIVDKSWLDNLFSTAEQFRKENRVTLSVDEYGVQRWAPGADKFMDDQMGIFEKNGWNYALWEWHTTFEPFGSDYDDFDIRYGDNPSNHKPAPNALQTVVTSYWARNIRRPSNTRFTQAATP